MAHRGNWWRSLAAMPLTRDPTKITPAGKRGACLDSPRLLARMQVAWFAREIAGARGVRNRGSHH